MSGRLSKKLGFDKAARFLFHKHLKWSIVIVCLIFILIIALGYWFKWDWTGLNAHVGPNVQQYQAGKTLWDWMSVLCIPAAIAFGSLWFTAQQSKTQDAENMDNQRERALQEYIDKISDLLLNHDLLESTLSIDSDLVIKGIEIKPDKEAKTVARAQTLTILSRLDGKRKGSVLKFLYESRLIEKDSPIVKLQGADLSGAILYDTKFWKTNIGNSNVSKLADFKRVDLSGANLSGADIRLTDICNANLSDAVLTFADLSVSYLHGTNLARANLKGAILINAILDNANFTRATITEEQLIQAYSLKGTIMPDGSSHS